MFPSTQARIASSHVVYKEVGKHSNDDVTVKSKQ